MGLPSGCWSWSTGSRAEGSSGRRPRHGTLTLLRCCPSVVVIFQTFERWCGVVPAAAEWCAGCAQPTRARCWQCLRRCMSTRRWLTWQVTSLVSCGCRCSSTVWRLPGAVFPWGNAGLSRGGLIGWLAAVTLQRCYQSVLGVHLQSTLHPAHVAGRCRQSWYYCRAATVSLGSDLMQVG
jgi:hypothetical protein